MKKTKKNLLLIITLILIVTFGYAHSGRTDSNGGHYNRATGEYHYHNSGSSNTRFSTINSEIDSKSQDIINSQKKELQKMKEELEEKNKEIQQHKKTISQMKAGIIILSILLVVSIVINIYKFKNK